MAVRRIYRLLTNLETVQKGDEVYLGTDKPGDWYAVIHIGKPVSVYGTWPVRREITSYIEGGIKKTRYAT